MKNKPSSKKLRFTYLSFFWFLLLKYQFHEDSKLCLLTAITHMP